MGRPFVGGGTFFWHPTLPHVPLFGKSSRSGALVLELAWTAGRMSFRLAIYDVPAESEGAIQRSAKSETTNHLISRVGQRRVAGFE
jgi:hypothetical protein